ncbi:hypothetical protein F8G81_22930 [Arthrobacter sp. CDRTa11]|uniref:hypothetical protein n=1 Tax=Arthrobacter sp. CDRTa11 TaxID=2651199 RepID=UPI002265E78B|nr:hypothetical protein [Arthrobacter sp. CDRTa11]UZX05127.1 hypothetical protein F8G81_22930 [Arthrobacter sp. CDRTa11]
MTPTQEIQAIFDSFDVPLRYRRDPRLLQTAQELTKIGGPVAHSPRLLPHGPWLRPPGSDTGGSVVENRVVMQEIFANQLRNRLNELTGSGRSFPARTPAWLPLRGSPLPVLHTPKAGTRRRGRGSTLVAGAGQIF